MRWRQGGNRFAVVLVCSIADSVKGKVVTIGLSMLVETVHQETLSARDRVAALRQV
jgi:hypothetical protein